MQMSGAIHSPNRLSSTSAQACCIKAHAQSMLACEGCQL